MHPEIDNRTVALDRILEPVCADMARLREELASVFADSEDPIRDLLDDPIFMGGKRLRGGLLLLAHRAAGGDGGPRVVQAGVVLELIHAATLVHDDILDEARLRHSRETLNQRWGNEMAVLLGDLLLAQAFQVCARIADTEVISILSDAARRTCEGELLQTRRRFDFDLGEEEYLEIVDRKTASLFSAAGRLGGVLAGAGSREVQLLSAFGREVGICFQIVDDLLDLVGEESEAGKSLGTDVEKGKLTLPLIALTDKITADDLRHVRAYLEGPPDPERRVFLRRILRDRGAIEYARAVSRRRMGVAARTLRELPESPCRGALRLLAEFIVSRRY